MSSREKPIRPLRTDWREILLVCRKCSKRLGGGFGPDGDRKLAKVLKRELAGAGKGRRAEVTVLEVGCFDICPKGAVVAIRAGKPGEVRLVPAGTAAGDVLAALGIAAPDSKNGPAGPS